jgi:glycosyltransferase involved in cell wall biosynthesis
MHVAVLGPAPNMFEAVPNGVTCATIELIRAFGRYCPEVKVTLVTLSDRVDVVTQRLESSVDVLYVPTRKKGRTWVLYLPDILRLKRTLQKLRPDVVHSQGLPEYILAGEFSGFPHIATIHGIIRNEAGLEKAQIKDLLRAFIRALMEQYYIRRVHHIIIISPYVKRFVEQVSRAHIYQIDNPINEKYFSISSKAIPGYILQVGSLVFRKGAHVLIEALSMIKEDWLKVHFVGGTPDARYQEELRRQISEKNVESKVVFHGAVSDLELLDCYSKASVVCLCSFEETSPLSLAQAMAVGKTIVASRSGGIPDLIHDGNTGILFEAGSSRELASILKKQIGETPENALAIKARQEALDRFHPKSVAKRTLDAYVNVCNHLK